MEKKAPNGFLRVVEAERKVLFGLFEVAWEQYFLDGVVAAAEIDSVVVVVAGIDFVVVVAAGIDSVVVVGGVEIDFVAAFEASIVDLEDYSQFHSSCQCSN